MRVNFPISITAADNKERTISGKIVTWNEKGNTSLGPTVFAVDSIEMKSVKLLLEHDRTRPLARGGDGTGSPSLRHRRQRPAAGAHPAPQTIGAYQQVCIQGKIGP